MWTHYHPMNNACTIATCAKGDFSFTSPPPLLLFLHHSAANEQWSPNPRENKKRRPAVGFNRKWVTLSQTQIWRKRKPCCKPGVKGWVESSYFVSKEPYECQWSSLTTDQLSQGVGGVCVRVCSWVCVIIRLRQGWWGACVCVCVHWQGGWLGIGPCWLGSCSDTESDATRENRQVLCTMSSESRPRDTLPPHCHHYEAQHTPRTRVRTCTRVYPCAHTYSTVH